MRITDEQIIAALMSAGSERGAAKLLNCSASTVRKRLEKSDLRARYAQEKQAALSEVSNTLQSRLVAAVDILSNVAQDDEVTPSVRVSAADALLRRKTRVERIRGRIVALLRRLFYIGEIFAGKKKIPHSGAAMRDVIDIGKRRTRHAPFHS